MTSQRQALIAAVIERHMQRALDRYGEPIPYSADEMAAEIEAALVDVAGFD